MLLFCICKKDFRMSDGTLSFKSGKPYIFEIDKHEKDHLITHNDEDSPDYHYHGMSMDLVNNHFWIVRLISDK